MRTQEELAGTERRRRRPRAARRRPRTRARRASRTGPASARPDRSSRARVAAAPAGEQRPHGGGRRHPELRRRPRDAAPPRHEAPTGPLTAAPLHFDWPRGVSSAGRASALQAEGRRFDPGTLHWFRRKPRGSAPCRPPSFLPGRLQIENPQKRILDRETLEGDGCRRRGVHGRRYSQESCRRVWRAVRQAHLTKPLPNRLSSFEPI